MPLRDPTPEEAKQMLAAGQNPADYQIDTDAAAAHQAQQRTNHCSTS